MKLPFVYDKIVAGPNFIGRDGEKTAIENKLKSGNNIILIAPKGWGKKSIINQASKDIITSHDNYHLLYIDLFNVRSIASFERVLMDEVAAFEKGLLKKTGGAERKAALKELSVIQRDNKVTKLEPDPKQNTKTRIKKDNKVYSFLDLPQEMADKYESKLIVWINEFQNVAYFNDSVAFQSQLRENWKKQEAVTYCMSCSKPYLFKDAISNQAAPYFPFAELITLEKIYAVHWEKYIQRQFKKSGKNAVSIMAREIAELVDCHPAYVQQLAQYCWFRTEKELQPKTIQDSLNAILVQMSSWFQRITDSLTDSQLNFLEALVKGEIQLASKQVIDKYNLSSSANVSRVKQALIQKEVIDEYKQNIELLDPVYSLWLKQKYFA